MSVNLLEKTKEDYISVKEKIIKSQKKEDDFIKATFN